MTQIPKRRRMATIGRMLPLLAAMVAASPAVAQRSLTIAASTPATALDPHFHYTGNNSQALRQIFDPLLESDTSGQLRPVLAESWRTLDDLTWEFRLREGVRFQDGTPFGPEDLAFSFARVPAVPNSPGSFTPFVRNIASIEVVDPRTVRIRTTAPTPFLDRDLANILILSRTIHAGASTADFNAGRVTIGTGPYRLTAHQANERLELAANADYWAGRPAWDRVVIRYVSNVGARTAALLSGEVDLIDAVAVQDVPRLSADPRLAVFSTESLSTAYLFPDAVREASPVVTDRAGRPIPNPLRDVRVRRALSLSINRAGIVERLLGGQGTPAEQFAPPVVSDRAPGMPPLAYDPARARALLTEAGYPNGFRLTIHGPNNFFAGDDQTLQAIAQGFTRIGVETAVEAIPLANFAARSSNREFSMYFTTFTSSLAANTLRQVVATRDDALSNGPFNRQRYSNPMVDGPLSEALRTMDPARRNALTAQAMRTVIEDVAVIPVFYLRNIWAGRRDRVIYDASPFGQTTAYLARPAH